MINKTNIKDDLVLPSWAIPFEKHIGLDLHLVECRSKGYCLFKVVSPTGVPIFDVGSYSNRDSIGYSSCHRFYDWKPKVIREKEEEVSAQK